MKITFSPLCESDFLPWSVLYRGFCEFYHTAASDEKIATVWGWLTDEEHMMKNVMARNEQGRPIGMAHYHSWPIPLYGFDICYLSDLFVDPKERGKGIGHALYKHLMDLSKENGFTVMSLLTQDGNKAARTLYDKYGAANDFRFYLSPLVDEAEAITNDL